MNYSRAHQMFAHEGKKRAVICGTNRKAAGVWGGGPGEI